MRSVVAEYLDAIYTLHAEGEDAYAVTLAELFGVSRANASATVGRMARDGLVHADGRQIALTEAGVARAEAAVLRHRLTERFLLETLGMDWATVHEQARAFEPGLSDLLEERIDRQAGHPTTCPHGNPIPRPDLDAATYLRDRAAIPLATAPAGSRATVLAISELVEGQADLLRFCADNGLQPGAHIDTAERGDGEEGATVLIEGRRIAVPRSLAARLWIVPENERRDT